MEITELLKSLCAAQAEYPVIPKTKEGQIQNRKFKYADLADIQKAVKPVNSKHGLVVTHETVEGDLVSTLSHVSGQAMFTKLKIPLTDDLKTLGATLTYLRRYNIQNLLDLAPDDDLDAVETKGSANQGDEKPKKDARPPANPMTQPQAPKEDWRIKTTVSEPQLKRLFAISNEKLWSHEQCKLYMSARWGLETSKDLNRKTYDELIDVIQEMSYIEAIKALNG